MTTALVIGASGFVGQALARALVARGEQHVRLAQRSTETTVAGAMVARLPKRYSDLSEAALDALFDDVDSVYHLAAATPQALSSLEQAERAVALKDSADMPIWFAKAALRRGCKRFTLVSTSHVHWNGAQQSVMSESSTRVGHDDYSLSKVDAENKLMAVGDVVAISTIIRPPVVYGNGMKGPMNKLLRLAAAGLPLPFGAMDANRRSMIGVNNLAHCLIHATTHPAAAGKAFVVADNELLSTKQFFNLAAKAAGKSTWQLPIPKTLMFGAAKVFGKGQLFERVFGDYRIDDAHIRRSLGWSAPYRVEDELTFMFHKEGLANGG